MFAFIFKNYKGAFDIYQSPFIGSSVTKGVRVIDAFVIYVAM